MSSPEKLFEKFDKNKDGLLSLNEFCDAALAFSRTVSREDLEKRFKEIDVNGDGVVNLDEFVSWMEKNLKRSFDLIDIDGNGKITSKEFYSVMNQIGRVCTEASCAKKVQAADADGDGYLNYEEFKAMMFSDI